MKVTKLFGATPPPPQRGVTVDLSTDEAVRLRRVLRHYGSLRRKGIVDAAGMPNVVYAIGDDGVTLSTRLDNAMRGTGRGSR